MLVVDTATSSSQYEALWRGDPIVREVRVETCQVQNAYRNVAHSLLSDLFLERRNCCAEYVMRKLALSVIALLLCASPATSQTPDVEKIIRALGPSTTRADLRVLRQSPRRAVELLLRDLTTIPDEKILPDAQVQHAKAMHVIWSIRALRYLTRQEFRASTTFAFGATDDERTRRDLLSAHGNKAVAFFAEWMSRGSIYIAPTDAQRKIISDWRKWHAREGQRWRLGPEPDFNEWYF